MSLLLSQQTRLSDPNRRPYLLLLIVIVILVGLSLTSCVTTRAYDRICNECRPVVVEKNDSSVTKEKITKRDTNLVVAAKEGPTVTKWVDCDDTVHTCCWRDAIEDLQKHPIEEKKNGITTTLHAVKENGKTKIEAGCKEDEYRLRLNNAITEREIYKQNWELLVKKEKERKCEIPHKTEYTHWAEWGFPILILIILAWAYFKVRLHVRGWLQRVMP